MTASWSDLGLSSAWMNAAGFKGYLPVHDAVEQYSSGAFVTNPISLLARSPAQNRCVAAFKGGFLMHTGHPNPGFESVIKNYASKWRGLTLPVWAHLLVSTPHECQAMVKGLENVDNVAVIELGLPPTCGISHQLELIDAAMGELPLVICLPLDEINPGWIEKLGARGIAGLVISAPRGTIVRNHRVMRGRLFGPALHPLMMEALHRLRGADMPILAGCGIFSREDGEAALDAGAAAIQVDGWCWQF